MSRGQWLVATGNAGKLSEIQALCADWPVAWRSLRDVPGVTLPPEGRDYRENALAKARTAAAASGLPALGDDSGLEVEALGGAPGPLSARYGGPGLDDAGRVQRLLGALREVPAGRRGARFVCWVAWADPTGEARVAEGAVAGRILPTPRGAGGFGYDPVFAPEELSLSMAELPRARKNALSHRARALAALAATLRRDGLLPERVTPAGR